MYVCTVSDCGSDCEKDNNSSPTADCTGFINYLLLNVFSSFSVCESS